MLNIAYMNGEIFLLFIPSPQFIFINLLLRVPIDEMNERY